ncbi:FxsA family protein [Sediminibacillus albus]|uniref:UPF0716 protein FxsA n=1 Tax=Sediminibacillus albus TaxID=407036 RepID=A0A1G9BU87_9BACI|nr:FxsA family protein [Sediminibacillus albus]SDK42890.1 UPF0716 protein FxsA [Sediminibacillus albus]
MFRWLILLVLIVPALEVGLLVWSGNLIGPWWVILLIISTGVLGAWLAKRQGLETVARAKQAMAYGQPPREEILDGICILLGAAVLLTPGFITDAFGFILLLPFTRKPVKQWMLKILRAMLNKGTITIFRK